MCVDLHTHSLFSDGSCTPRRLVELAVSKGITALALTDHDIMSGVDELLHYGEISGLLALSGVEISALHQSISLHILGYGLDHHDPVFADWLSRLQSGREQRNYRIISSLQELGIAITYEELEEYSVRGLIGRPHIANLLIQKGVVRSFHEAFQLYLGKGRKAWQRRFCYSAVETIRAIHDAGGIAVLAHPGQLDPTFRIQPALLRELVLHGLDGVEVYYPSHTRRTTRRLFSLAENLKLVITGGSDYHGDTRPANMMAGKGTPLCPPESLLDDLYGQLQKYQ